MNKKLWIGLGFISLLIIFFFILREIQKEPSDQSHETIKVGVATLLHGDFAIVGENIVKTAQLTIDEINKNGGIHGKNLELLVEDSGYTSKEGLSAVQKLINTDHIHYLIAGMTSNGTLAAANLLNRGKIVSLSPVTGGSNIDNAGDYIFRIANSDILAGRDLANAMIAKNIKTASVVYENTEYTTDIVTSFLETYAKLGGEIISTDNFQPNVKDYRTVILKLKDSKPDGILLLSQLGTNAAEFIKQSRQLNYNIPLFTDFTLISNPDVKKILSNLNGIYYADPSFGPTDHNAFTKEYELKYKTLPPIPFHSFATYDSLMILKKAIEKVGDNPEKVATFITQNTKNYKGLMGTYSLDEKGNSDLGFEIKHVTK